MKPFIYKLYFLTIAFTAFSQLIFAQVPEKMSFQAVVRNTSGTLVTNQNVTLRFSILEGPLPGTVVYTETQNSTTNSNGLVSVEIGSITPITANWSTSTNYLKTEIDPAGGSSFTISTTTQLITVPYAFHSGTSDYATYSETSGSSTPGPQGDTGPAGNGIVSTIDNGNGTFTFNYSDGSSFTTSDLTGPQGDPGISESNIQNTASLLSDVFSTTRNSVVLTTDYLTIPENGYYLIIYHGKGNNNTTATGFDPIYYDLEGRTGVINITQSPNFINSEYVTTFDKDFFSNDFGNNHVYSALTHSLSIITYANAGDQIKIGTVVFPNTSTYASGTWSVVDIRLEAIKLRD